MLLTSDGDTQIQFINYSEVKFVCVRIPRVSTRVRHVGKYGHLIDPYRTFNRHRTANPIQSLCGRVGEHHMACGGWLVCQTTSVCNKPIYYMYGSNSSSCILCVRMLRWNSDGHIELGTVWAMDPKPCSLARWTRILRIRQHIVWDKSRGSTQDH